MEFFKRIERIVGAVVYAPIKNFVVTAQEKAVEFAHWIKNRGMSAEDCADAKKAKVYGGLKAGIRLPKKARKHECRALALSAALAAGGAIGFAMRRHGWAGVKTPRFTIGTFNVRNFKTKATGETDPKDFKNIRAERVAELIRSSKMSIVALQEVKSAETVEYICRCLNKDNKDGGHYQYRHCASIYKSILEEEGLRMKSPHESRGELAYIWDDRVVELSRGESVKVIYKGIEERMAHQWDVFVASAAMIFVGANRAYSAMCRKKKKPDGAEISTDLTSIGAGFAVAGQLGVTPTGEETTSKEKAESMLRKLLRPPLIAIFSMKNDRNKQIRLINVHLRFGVRQCDDAREGESESKLAKRLRKEELSFAARNLFEIVDSQRGGGNESQHTLLLGDMNLLPNEVEDVLKRKSFKQHNLNLEVHQKEKTTVKLINGKDVENGKDPVYDVANSYDHFIFKSDIWKPKASTETSTSVVRLDSVFYAKRVDKKGLRKIKYPISDHLPVVISTDKI